jgi:hypothetical protein
MKRSAPPGKLNLKERRFEIADEEDGDCKSPLLEASGAFEAQS